MYISTWMLSRAAAMSRRIAGKNPSPFCSTSTRLPPSAFDWVSPASDGSSLRTSAASFTRSTASCFRFADQSTIVSAISARTIPMKTISGSRT